MQTYPTVRGSRSIPAYAGDPVFAARDAALGKVYPRLRGGSAERAVITRLADGLSPPTRGILRARRIAYNRDRSIPAYAGDPRIRRVAVSVSGVYPRLRGGSFDVEWETP